MRRNYLPAVIGLLAGLALIACGSQEPAAAPEATTAPGGTTTPDTASSSAILLYAFSNSSPHVSVIDTATHAVVQTAGIPDFTSWTWNDDNNFFDGENLWLGTKDPDTNEVAVLLLNLETLEVTDRIPLGTDEVTLYIGKPSRQGILFVSKHASGQVAAIDIDTHEVLEIKDIPVNGGVACDMDVAVGSDDVERVFVPTDNGDTVLALDSETLEPLSIYEGEPDTRPFMLTAATTKDQVWVQERNTNANLVLDAITLEVIERLPAGEGVIMNSFSPDEKLSYLGHSSDVIVSVVDTETLDELRRIQVGINPQKLAVHPNGQFVYTILTKEGAVAVIDTKSWQVVSRIPLGTNPTTVYVHTPES
jgi:DNA-binding beta-propeller fold protein YncE